MVGSLLATRGFLVFMLSPYTDSTTQSGHFIVEQSTDMLIQNRAVSRINYTRDLLKLNGGG